MEYSCIELSLYDQIGVWFYSERKKESFRAQKSFRLVKCNDDMDWIKHCTAIDMGTRSYTEMILKEDIRRHDGVNEDMMFWSVLLGCTDVEQMEKED